MTEKVLSETKQGAETCTCAALHIVGDTEGHYDGCPLIAAFLRGAR